MNFYNMPLHNDIIKCFNADSLKPLTSKDAENELEKKHITILEAMDFTPYQIIAKDKNPLYILYDNNRGSFYAFVDNLKEEHYTDSTIKRLLYLLPEDYFKGYEFDREKVFNDDILNIEECSLDNEESFNKTKNIDKRLK